MVRIIHFIANDSTPAERIHITTDTDSDSADFVPEGWEVMSDETHDIDLPGDFPTETTFEKVF